MASESIGVALQTLRANPLRTLLSTLGVVIGVAALISILSLADGLEAFSRKEIETTTDLQVVTVTPIVTDRVDDVVLRRRDYPVFVLGDAVDLAARLGDAATVGLWAAYATFWRSPEDTTPRQVMVAAASPAALAMEGLQVAAGRLLSRDDLERASRVAVVSPGIARRLASTREAALGRHLVLGDDTYRVVGVAAGDASEEKVGRVAVPLVPPASLPGAADPQPPALVVKARRVEAVDSVRGRTEAWLAARWGPVEKTFSVSSHIRRLEQAKKAMLLFKLVMGAITGISLLVGGIGIMNVLLASITERTREIGIRRAAGARRRSILHQFLAESIAISAVGSGLGVLLGLAMSLLGAAVIRRIAVAEVQAVFAWESLVLGVAAALLVGLVFGIYPALRAARLSPMEALRHE